MQMEIDRRDFVQLTVGTVLACALCGCASESGAQNAPPPAKAGSPMDAGAVTQYSADGIYDAHQEQGFFVVRQGENLFAVASVCTHRRCKLRAEPDHSFLCPCHGSKFNPMAT